MPSKLVSAAGVAAAALWAAMSLAERAAWPRLGVMALLLSVAAAILFRTAGQLPRILMMPSRCIFVGACALVASSVSWWLSRYWLRGMPVVIDSAVYLMQARAMTHLHFGMRVPAPLQAFSNHFVLEGPDQRLYGVFPPGWPLAIVPFVWIGAPMLVGPALAAMLVVAQAALGRAVALAGSDEEGGEVATRLSLLVALPSYARAIETADLLSHAFLALLVTVAMACAIRLLTPTAISTPTRRGLGIVLGACVGWAFCTRLLDGAVLILAIAGLLVWTARGRSALSWALAGSSPFLLLLAVEQRCATGAWLLPTQTAYFTRSDWPPNCHRLGFGPGVGCTVEHQRLATSFGAGGYDVGHAIGVVRERARVFGEDLFGFAPIALLAFVPLALGASAIDAIGVSFLLALTLAYGLFYYGNAAIFGARHLFPAAPFVWLLTARASLSIPHRARGWLDKEHARGACIGVLLAVVVFCARGPWRQHGAAAIEDQTNRSDLRRSLERRGVSRGILKSLDQTAVAAAFDSWLDGDERLFVVDDRSALVELRRAHPQLPFMLSLPHDEIGTLYARPAPPGVLVELERTWPTFVRPSGLGVSRFAQDGASGGSVLRLAHAHPGAEVAIPFEVAISGDYLVRVDGMAGPAQGDYSLVLDGLLLADWHGYQPRSTAQRGSVSPRQLDAGRHTLVARCAGRDERSDGYDALLDTLIGEVP